MTKTKVALVFFALALSVSGAGAASAFKKARGNALLHTPSNVLFPPGIGLFNRAHTNIYGSDGRDVSVRYFLDALVLGDVYVYPVGTYGSDLSGEFRVQQVAIGQKNKNVKLAAETNIQTIQNGRTIKGRKAVYELVRGLFGELPHKCGSQLIVFRDGPWFVAYRFSYPLERSEIASKHVADFLARWQWRER
jgi:hypothetical protein